MTDSINNLGRRVQTEAAQRDAMAKAGAAKVASDVPAPEAPAKPASGAAVGGRDTVELSNVAQKAMAEPDFDRAKVEAIKQAIKDGQYAINPRKIAESFYAMERMIE
jgi:negative regulator of flagellin synthesis FlgM